MSSLSLRSYSALLDTLTPPAADSITPHVKKPNKQQTPPTLRLPRPHNNRFPRRELTRADQDRPTRTSKRSDKRPQQTARSTRLVVDFTSEEHPQPPAAFASPAEICAAFNKFLPDHRAVKAVMSLLLGLSMRGGAINISGDVWKQKSVPPQAALRNLSIRHKSLQRLRQRLGMLFHGTMVSSSAPRRSSRHPPANAPAQATSASLPPAGPSRHRNSSQYSCIGWFTVVANANCSKRFLFAA
ncbi:hypothetical protein B0H14DRAFT_3436948 [Mycena olivaceomarginata]|nr:hypothetical protein B0H14DRAFT_3436948 [Mycena olivaceomarginata]